MLVEKRVPLAEPHLNRYSRHIALLDCVLPRDLNACLNGRVIAIAAGKRLMETAPKYTTVLQTAWIHLGNPGLDGPGEKGRQFSQSTPDTNPVRILAGFI